MITLSIILVALVYIQGTYNFFKYIRLYHYPDVASFILSWITTVLLFAALFYWQIYWAIIIQAILCLIGDRNRINQIKKHNDNNNL